MGRFRRRITQCLLAAAAPLVAAGCGMMDPEPVRALVAAIDFGQIKFQNEGLRLVEVTADRLKLGARANSDAEEIRLQQADAAKQ